MSPKPHAFILSILPVILLAIAGCSGSHSATIPQSSDALTSAGVASAQGAGRYLWGLYDITLDDLTGEAKIVPLRSGEGHVNTLKFLEQSPCASCVTISNVTKVGPKEFLADVQIRHPFVGLDKYTGFDVRGTVMFDGTYTFPGSGYSYPDPLSADGGCLLNPDGYTTLFNPPTYPPGGSQWPAWEYQVGKLATAEYPNATLNPYKAFQVTKPRRYFGCTTANTRTYHIRFAQNAPSRFGYAVDANWAPPSKDPPKVPDDFPLEANIAEAYELGFTITANNLWCNSSAGGGGDIAFKIIVHDHQDAHLITNGGTVDKFYWEIPGMTGWGALQPTGWEEGVDSAGPFVAYSFLEAPVPDVPGLHRSLICVTDKELGLQGIQEKAFLVTEITVGSGESCWSPGLLISDIPSESYEAHLQNAHSSFVDPEGVFHLYYLDNQWQVRHLSIDAGTVADEVIMPGEVAFNLNAVRDTTGTIHLLYADTPYSWMRKAIYREISPTGELGPAIALSAKTSYEVRELTLTIAPNGTMLAAWMWTPSWPTRYLAAAYFDGVEWSKEMTWRVVHLPNNWVDPGVIVDSSSVYHIFYNDNDPPDLFYSRFEDGTLGPEIKLIGGPQSSLSCLASIDTDDRIYATFEDNREGAARGYLMMRDPVTGDWSQEIDITGHNYITNRYQNVILPDGRLAVIWTDWRDATRGLYSKVFDPFFTETQIQGTPDDEIDEPFSAQKNQPRLCMSPDGTLHLVWSDERSGHWQLYYATCTP